jgi:predicted dinucleotide-binding enzyme
VRDTTSRSPILAPPETIDGAALKTGARAVWVDEVTANVDVVIVSVNFGKIPAIAGHVRRAPEEAVVIDLTNHYPGRDGDIDGLGDGQTESVWFQEQQYGRPLIKAWSTLTTESLRDKAVPPGAPGRIALPVLGDDAARLAVAMSLVERTGFDAVEAGTIADSWRVQPGTPAYATDLTAQELRHALHEADALRAARRRDLMIAVLEERSRGGEEPVDPAFMLSLTRLLFT